MAVRSTSLLPVNRFNLEDERMVTDNHLATRLNCFFHHRFGAVQTHHDLGDRGIH